MARQKFTMTRKRADWGESRDATLKGDALRPNARSSERYSDEVAKMVTRMNEDVSRELSKLFKSDVAKSYAMDASIASQATIVMNRLAKEWQAKFNKFAKDYSSSMVTRQTKDTAKDLSASLKTLSGGLSINTATMSQRTKDIAKASAEQSTSLIKSISADYLSEVREGVMRAITDSSQSFESLKSSINSLLEGKYKTYKNKAHNTSMDQIRKAYQGISDQRMRDAGVNEFEWVHSGRSKNPRSYHKNVLNGNIYSLDDPPIVNPSTGERGLPGSEIFCACVKRPIVKFG